MPEHHPPPGDSGPGLGEGLAPEWLAGQDDPLTPVGEFPQVSWMISGLSRQTGRRRTAARLVAAVIVVMILFTFIIGILRR